jgi:membrane protein
LLLALSLWVQASINDAVKPVLLWLSPNDVTVGVQDTIDVVARVVGIILGLMVNALLAASLLSGVSRLRMSLRRLIPSTLLVAIGLSGLSTVGRLYIDFSARRPAYQLVGGTVALLLFLYLFNQLLLYGAALAATSRHGTVVDLAAESPPADDANSEGTDDSKPSDADSNASDADSKPSDVAIDDTGNDAPSVAESGKDTAVSGDGTDRSTNGGPPRLPSRDHPAGAPERRR